MALVDRALQAKDLGESLDGPAQDEEFVLYHSDNTEAQGFVQHLKLPHYIDFQAELNLIRKLRSDYEQTKYLGNSPLANVEHVPSDSSSKEVTTA